MSKHYSKWSLGSLVCLAVAPMIFALAASAEEPDALFFHDNYQETLLEAKQTQKPIFLEFRCEP